MSYLPQIIDARYCDGFRIHLRFSDGVEGVVDFRQWLVGPIFEPVGPSRRDRPIPRR
jgi:hypothetical protein